MRPFMLTWVDIGDPVAFQEKQDKRVSVFDPVWRLVSNMVRPVSAVIAIMIAAVLFGWSFWKGEELKVGDSQAHVTDLLLDSRTNPGLAMIDPNFKNVTDILQLTPTVEPETCVRYDQHWASRRIE